ncbi:DUF3761 domain-containing protein [Xenorhabdus cabanillasii]|uniref:Uncharacterized protein DUF3761 n=2 Tax=Xenorhabdus cabanillasii TaxID=351673 RepID=A0A3D9UC02_9GAMM|nr:DUF3761 domain-containing protein [Xenorhabdus cabanillasii]PHM78970.1 Acid shock protein [Xenorhabdus cabanillasii JM26]REF26919.1 uncharacterized protein DUF3761 [Xenorhabdus cabanillasii]CDL79353.1 conserved exported hypothetical protein [Xenorhabdus cabanillasii JM26]
MKILKLSVAALLVLFSSAVLAAPTVSTDHTAKTATTVEKSAKTAENKVSSLEKKAGENSKKLTKKGNTKAKKGMNTALCKDGTYSKSKSRKGACSRHGGVAKWL